MITYGELEIAGLDVAVGSLHADQNGRASLVYDFIKPLRPVVDKIIFAWVTTQRWRRADFVIDRQGVISTERIRLEFPF
ncbi:MAG: CRISPR-associated endonuclease Cas1 [Nitrosomonas sp.]|nr:CRISPR-associated endonuclease Cas1 [Nitrosomonas sp.]